MRNAQTLKERSLLFLKNNNTIINTNENYTFSYLTRKKVIVLAASNLFLHLKASCSSPYQLR